MIELNKRLKRSETFAKEVSKARRSESAKHKDATHSGESSGAELSGPSADLLQDMATLTRNNIRFESSESVFHQLTESTILQCRALEFLATHAYPDPALSFKDL